VYNHNQPSINCCLFYWDATYQLRLCSNDQSRTC